MRLLLVILWLDLAYCSQKRSTATRVPNPRKGVPQKAKTSAGKTNASTTASPIHLEGTTLPSTRSLNFLSALIAGSGIPPSDPANKSSSTSTTRQPSSTTSTTIAHTASRNVETRLNYLDVAKRGHTTVTPASATSSSTSTTTASTTTSSTTTSTTPGTTRSDASETRTMAAPTRLRYIDAAKRGVTGYPKRLSSSDSANPSPEDTTSTGVTGYPNRISSTDPAIPSCEDTTSTTVGGSTREPMQKIEPPETPTVDPSTDAITFAITEIVAEPTTQTTTDTTTITSIESTAETTTIGTNTELTTDSTTLEGTQATTEFTTAMQPPVYRRRVVPIRFGIFDPVDIEVSDEEETETTIATSSAVSTRAPETETPVPTKAPALTNGSNVADGTTSEETMSCGSPRSADIPLSPIEQYIGKLIDDGPLWKVKPVNNSQWEHIYNQFALWFRYQDQVDVENGRLYPQPHSQIQPGIVYPTWVGNLTLIQELTMMRSRPIAPHITYRQYFAAHPSETIDGLTDCKYVEVKTSDLNSDNLVKEEYLILELLRKSRVPASIPLYLSGTPPGFVFEARFSALIVPRAPTLFQYMSTKTRTDPIEIMSIARELLGLLSQLHSYGIAHGSFSGHTVLFGDKFGAPYLSLTEFEFAAFLGTVDRSMLTQRYRAQMHLMEMSPFEMQEYRLSRRDDLFRWMEVIARLLYGPQFDRVMQKEASTNGLLEFKMSRKYFTLNGFGGAWNPWRFLDNNTKRQVKQVLGVMLEYVRSLEIDEDPDYVGLDTSLVTVIQLIRCAS